MKNNKKLVQAWIAEAQFKQLAKIAKELRRSKTSLAEEAVEKFILNHRYSLKDFKAKYYQEPISIIDEFLKEKEDE